MFRLITQLWKPESYLSSVVFLIILAATIILPGLGLRDPWPADEPRFAEVAREMVVTNQWFFPSRAGEYYPDKPPVFMWSIAAIYWLTGNLNIAFLLPSALCALLTIYLIFDIGSQIWDVKTGRNAALLLLITPQFIFQSKTAQIDMMLTTWTVLACYGFLRHFFVKKSWLWYFSAWGFMGLGVITKGVGFLPIFMVLPIAILSLRRKELFKNFQWRIILGPLMMITVIALWLVPMLLIVSNSNDIDLLAYRDNILFKQTGQRYLNAWHHHKPWYYFLSNVIPLLWFPLLPLFVTQWNDLKTKKRKNHIIQTLLIYVVCIILFFSFSPGKRGVYILPALPFFALLLAPNFALIQKKNWFDIMIKGFMIFCSITFIAATIIIVLQLPEVLKLLGDSSLIGIALFFATLTIFWVGLLWIRKNKAIMPTFIAAITTTWVMYGIWLTPMINSNRTPEKMMQKTAELIGSDAELGLIKFKEQFILFSPIPITHFGYQNNIEKQCSSAYQWMNEKPNRFLLIPEKIQPNLIDLKKGQLIGHAHRKNWILVDKNALIKNIPLENEMHAYTSPKQVWKTMSAKQNLISICNQMTKP